jgi:hypothetical protein
VETADTLTTGLVLLLIAPLLFAEAPAYVRGGYTAEFWRSSPDEKLDHVAAHPRYWVQMGLAWLPVLVLAVAGMAAFTAQLAALGQATVAYASLGAYITGSAAWLFAVMLQTAAVRRAAEIRAATGTTPDWLQPVWDITGWAELAYIAAANVAFIGWGIAVLDTGHPASWAGWACLALAAVALLVVGFTREGFPQLGVLVPVVLGVALVLA